MSEKGSSRENEEKVGKLRKQGNPGKPRKGEKWKVAEDG